MKVYKLDFHSAKHTPARTYWRVKTVTNEIITITKAHIDELIEVLYSTYDSKKTHWFVYIKVLKPNAIAGFIRERISNRGNTSSQFFTLEEMKKFKASKEEVELLKDLVAILEEGE